MGSPLELIALRHFWAAQWHLTGRDAAIGSPLELMEFLHVWAAQWRLLVLRRAWAVQWCLKGRAPAIVAPWALHCLWRILQWPSLLAQRPRGAWEVRGIQKSPGTMHRPLPPKRR